MGEQRCIKAAHVTDHLLLPERLHVAVWAPAAPGKALGFFLTCAKPALWAQDALEINKMHLFESMPDIKQLLGFTSGSLVGVVILWLRALGFG